MNRLTMSAIAGALFVSACATAIHDESTQSSADVLADLMADIFETSPDDPDNDIRDQRVRVENPNFPGVWLYYQLNTGPEKSVYRQRVIELTDIGGAVIQKTYGLKDPEKFVDAWDNPALIASMAPTDIEPYFEEGCEQVWRREAGEWSGAVDRETCRIFSERRQSYIFIEAEARLDETAYKQTERGYDESGEKLFGGEPGEFIILYRQ